MDEGSKWALSPSPAPKRLMLRVVFDAEGAPRGARSGAAKPSDAVENEEAGVADRISAMARGATAAAATVHRIAAHSRREIWRGECVRCNQPRRAFLHTQEEASESCSACVL